MSLNKEALASMRAGDMLVSTQALIQNYNLSFITFLFGAMTSYPFKWKTKNVSLAFEKATSKLSAPAFIVGALNQTCWVVPARSGGLCMLHILCVFTQGVKAQYTLLLRTRVVCFGNHPCPVSTTKNTLKAIPDMFEVTKEPSGWLQGALLAVQIQMIDVRVQHT